MFEETRHLSCIFCLKKHDIYLLFSFQKTQCIPLDFLCLEMRHAWLFPCPGNLLVSIIKKLMKCLMKHQVSILFLWEFRSENTQFFIVNRVCDCLLSLRVATMATHALTKLHTLNVSSISGVQFVHGPYLNWLQPLWMPSVSCLPQTPLTPLCDDQN